MNIAKNSPHLAGLLSRLIKKEIMTASGYELIDDAFCISMQHGGKEEIDFVRDPDVSFNPRAARAALILIKDAKETSVISIAATIIASVYDSRQNLEFDAAVLNLAKESLKEASEIESRSAALVGCSLWLDRARHLHQIAEENRSNTWSKFLELHKNYLAIAKKHSESLYVLLFAWEQRFKKQFDI